MIKKHEISQKSQLGERDQMDQLEHLDQLDRLALSFMSLIEREATDQPGQLNHTEELEQAN